MNPPGKQYGNIVMVRMCFVLGIHAHLPLTEAGQRLVGMVADLQVWLFARHKNKHYNI